MRFLGLGLPEVRGGQDMVLKQKIYFKMNVGLPIAFLFKYYQSSGMIVQFKHVL